MLHLGASNYEKHFQKNLADWCAGGPSRTGWTRTGSPIVLPTPVKLGPRHPELIEIDEVLAKNRPEFDKWHLAFLRDGLPPERTRYWREYLLPRYTLADARAQVQKFLLLFHDIRQHGYRPDSRVWLADLSPLDLGFRYFRFDGSHRAACAKVLGLPQIPAYVFPVIPKRKNS